ncbi:BPTI/Kunitz inhibitor domain-containing protein [Caenorhabditis elegans]|uniref:BPTI/Kunitz inhibitor domain-containing protein n=1 Tax=Caenorhabditis elegans TaxID=6239 RepID=F8Y417_CAEEL|nr:BPTI/Kunitz inhibitor domain-containing protein [Caenorhabditis elegans]CCD72531.2 BPTI/Kunitz inhibitor domain-containing protein [Caenorhabditis elegans]|eukprot:NP_001343686.1 Uncharacterized protein CELE_T21D12.7 [Caenorhabditis elegans]
MITKTSTIFQILLLLGVTVIHLDGNELGGFVCRLPKNVGFACGVTTPHSAYYFDSEIRECIEFMFEGCGGNQNRFSSRQECINGCKSLTQCGKGMPLMDFAGNIKRCDGERVPCPGSHECVGNGMSSVCCQKAGRICQASVHPGTPCGVPPATRYYFDSSSKTCRPFAFTGCGGNENNFKGKGECMMFCSSEIICPRGEPHADRYSINNIATCMEDKHCPRNYTCTSKVGKKGACCPSKEFVCGTPFEIKNNCRKPEPVNTWWFDYRKGECKRAEHSNCEEHFNSFANQEQCADYCVGTCPNNLEVHSNPRTGQPHLCDFLKNEGCPMGFECLKSSPYASICCKTHPVCPSAESILLVDEENEAVRCSSSRDSCPEQYMCQQAKNLEHICCTKPLNCPAGMDALRENGGRPRICSMGVDGNCPHDHMCVQGDGSFGAARHLCCKPRKKCVIPYVDPDKKRPIRCFPGDQSCPISTDCLPALENSESFSNLTNAIDVMFFCCHTVSIFSCPDGASPFLDPNSGQPATCLASNPFSCPAEHSCTALMDGSTACCPIQTPLCVEALVSDDGSPKTCLGWDDNTTCPQGKCQKAMDGVYYCCRPPMMILQNNAPIVPQVEGVSDRVTEYIACSLGILYTDFVKPKKKRQPEYLKLLRDRRASKLD